MGSSEFKKIPKVELHLHLDGCVSVESAYEMLRESSGQEPYYRMPVSELRQKMVINEPLCSQAELLSYFQIPTVVLQTKDHLKRAYYELCKMKAEDHVCYCEVRFAPQLHTMEGLTIDEVLDSVLEGKRQGERDFDIITNVIVVGLKDKSSDENINMLDVVKKYRKFGVVAVGCAGVEAGFPVMDQKKFLLHARQLGFFITFHCGEIRESLSDLITATHLIRPDRIAHGSIAIESPELCGQLIKNQIMLEICPTSNIQAGLYSEYTEVPVKELHEIGVPVSISTDDTVLSGITLSEELEQVSRHMKLTSRELAEWNIQAMRHSFADNQTKEAILKKINAYLKGELT